MIDADDLSDVWDSVVPGMTTATLRVRSRPSGATADSYTDYSIPRAKFKRLRKEDIPLVGGLEAASRYRIIQVWQDALTEVAAPNPKVGDVWKDTSLVSWVVEWIDHKLLDQVHNCMSRRLS